MDDLKVPPHILVVDDSRVYREVLQGILSDSHYRVSLVADGDAALSKALSAPPELVLMDVQMPGMTGYEVCRTFKQTPLLQDIPIIFLSAQEDSQDKVEAFESGGVDYVTKPFQLNELKARIATHLALGHYRQQLEARNQELASTVEALQSVQIKLTQADKMASIGTLAAGVAHEINNPIGYINSNLKCLARYFGELNELLTQYETMEKWVEPSDRLAPLQKLKQAIDLPLLKEDIADLIAESCEGTTRVKKIVQDLKDFSHADQGDRVWSDLQAGIESTLNVACNEIKYKAEVIKEYDDIPLVQCVPSQINQVFLNLLVNAAQAILKQGTIWIRTGQGKDPSWVYIEVEDDGCGIPQENLCHLFEPFYTTKPVGKGTGLGLSLSHGIVEQHKGSIEVRSEPGKGSCFRINLPVQSEPQVTEPIT